MDKNTENTQTNTQPKIGQRVRVKRLIERFPFFIVKEGTGTVVQNDKYGIGVKLDQLIDNCEEWDNCIQWYDDMLEEFPDDVELISETEVK